MLPTLLAKQAAHVGQRSASLLRVGLVLACINSGKQVPCHNIDMVTVMFQPWGKSPTWRRPRPHQPAVIRLTKARTVVVGRVI